MSINHLAITMGDPAGIGPEICLKFIAKIQDQLSSLAAVPVIFGDATILDRVAYELGLTASLPELSIEDFNRQHEQIDFPCLVSCSPVSLESIKPGGISLEGGVSSYEFVEQAIAAALSGRVCGVVTGPIQKEAWHMAGIPFTGHTELFACQTETNRYCMMLTSDEVTCSFVTSHVGISEVADRITEEAVFDTIQLTRESLLRIHGREPRLIVCGLNPHAGEHGLIGRGEEEQSIRPAITRAQKQGWHVIGPLPADTAFLPATRKQTDGYICMYHDQGLTVLKALAFDLAVNVTLGLPIVRTSVDHGTAMDIAGKGIAEISSLVEAFRLAEKLAALKSRTSNTLV